MWSENTNRFPNFNGAAGEVWEWIGYFIPHIIMGVNTYPFWDLSWTITGWLVSVLTRPNFELTYSIGIQEIISFIALRLNMGGDISRRMLNTITDPPLMAPLHLYSTTHAHKSSARITDLRLRNYVYMFTLCQFCPSGIIVACVCCVSECVCVSVCQHRACPGS